LENWLDPETPWGYGQIDQETLSSIDYKEVLFRNDHCIGLHIEDTTAAGPDGSKVSVE